MACFQFPLRIENLSPHLSLSGIYAAGAIGRRPGRALAGVSGKIQQHYNASWAQSIQVDTYVLFETSLVVGKFMFVTLMHFLSVPPCHRCSRTYASRTVSCSGRGEGQLAEPSSIKSHMYHVDASKHRHPFLLRQKAITNAHMANSYT